MARCWLKNSNSACRRRSNPHVPQQSAPWTGRFAGGDDPASAVYVANKEKACARIGVESFGSHLPADATAAQVLEAIRALNANARVDGILLQLPLPEGLDEAPLLAAIDPEKDADGLHTLNLGRLLKGEPGPRSCTPAG